MAQFYLLLRDTHYWISRGSLLIAVVMLVIAAFIAFRGGDVTRTFRRATYVIFGLMLLQSLIGGIMYVFIGTRPYEPVHLIYGLGATLSLPFFIFVETTAKKRPAMGSYLWGFALLAGIVIRSIMTGAAG